VRFERYFKMAVAGEVTYVRRFAGKFVEIVAAGIGTAVSGYLVAFLAAHFSFFSLFTPATVAPTLPQATGWPAEPRATASIEATVRAALASHDLSRAAPVVATLQAPAPASSTPAAPETQASLGTQASPETQASPDTQVSAIAVAPPLATAEIRSLPVATADSSLPAEPEGWPSDPSPVSSTGRLPIAGNLGRLPPQPPPANVNVLTALKHFF
jgi:hypothetical protein